ncbi:MAG: hypothetical protein CMJ85_13860 [Planctomycetes bacterium]|nr:hypothetical protein [Planctomycetota bacterium]
MAAPTIRELFDPEFLASIDRLVMLARRVAPAGSPSEKKSKRPGVGMEFRDFHAYTPGDDFKAIDWNVYQRLGKVFLRRFEEERNLPVYIAPDTSRSMFFGDNPRGHAALKVAFAFSAIALRERDSVGVFPFSNSADMALRPSSGFGRLMRVAQTLTALSPGGDTDFVKSMRKLQAIKMREGLLIVISDFFDPNGIEAVVRALQQVHHRLLLVQLVRKSDADPRLEGDLLLQDCETGEEQNVSATPAVIDAYRKAYKNFQDQLVALAMSRHAGLVHVDVDEDIVDQIAEIFATGAYVV